MSESCEAGSYTLASYARSKFVKFATNTKNVKKNKTRVQMPQGGAAEDALTLPSEMGFVGFW
jgi:hypothetical protein